MSRTMGGLVVACLALNVMLAVSSAGRKSVTVDEFANLPHGLALLQGRAFHVDPGSPPLPRMLPALLVRALGPPVFDPSPLAERRSSWELGRVFAHGNRADYARHFLRGRYVSIAVLLLTCLLTLGYAWALYGRVGGLLAGALVSLAPNLIAHGRLITPDVYLAAATVAALWALHGWQERPTVRRLCVMGGMIGLAVLCKLTGLLLLAVLPLVSCASAAPGRRWRTLRAWPLAIAVAMAVVNLGYGFDGAMTRLDGFDFSTPLATAVQSVLPPWLPVPLPFELVRGVDVQLGLGGYESYLFGSFSESGFGSYYLVALAVKVPFPLLALSLVAMLLRPRPTRREMPLLAVTIGLVTFFSVAGQRNIGVRYVLFVIPLLCVWIARVTTTERWCRPGWLTPLRTGVVVGFLWLFVGTVAAWPHYLPFFNLPSGGAEGGHRYLLDSNVDWGQDLVALREYMREQEIERVDLAYFGRVPPELYGIRYRSLFDDHVRASHAVISVNFLWGQRYFVNGSSYWPVGDAYASFRDRTPTTVLGHTLYVFGPEEHSRATEKVEAR